MTTLHWLNGVICLALFVIVSLFLTHKIAFCYGVFVSVINLLLSYGYFYWHQSRVIKQFGQSLSIVTKSVIVRIFAMILLLILGFRLSLNAEALMIGFVLGQFFYFLNQLIRIVEHGK